MDPQQRNPSPWGGVGYPVGTLVLFFVLIFRPRSNLTFPSVFFCFGSSGGGCKTHSPKQK